MTGRIRGVLGALALAAVIILGSSGAATAEGGMQRCLDQAITHNGEPPTCTKENGQWVASWPDDGSGLSANGGIPGFFGVFFVLAIVAAVGVTVWRVSTARSLARGSGLDPGLATQMTLLSEDGLDATYLAASLRQPGHPPEKQPSSPTAEQAPATGAARSAADRLAELKTLLDQGLISQTEYDERRKAIIDGV